MPHAINLPAIDRGPAYQIGGILDPSALAGRPIPAREWFVEGLIPHQTVMLFTGDGGLGKSLLMQQLATAAATGCDWLGLRTRRCRTFMLACEDSNAELWRRQRNVCDAYFLDLGDAFDVRLLSGEGLDPVLMVFDTANRGRLTRFYEELLVFLRGWAPELVIIDTLSDTFGGNELSRVQTRTFINACLGRICGEIGATVILTGHPSRMGMREGDGLSGSTAWNNSVRSRLYLERASGECADPDARVLTSKKSNYGPAGGEIHVRWSNGAFHVANTLTLQSAEALQSRAETAYVRALLALAKRGQNVTLAPNQATYAPKIMARMPETDGFKVAALEHAQERLLQRGVIANEEDMRKPPSRRSRFVQLANGDTAAALIETALQPEAPFPESRADPGAPAQDAE